MPGSPLPPSYYAADVGYLVDGTDMLRAGNLSVQAGRISGKDRQFRLLLHPRRLNMFGMGFGNDGIRMLRSWNAL